MWINWYVKTLWLYFTGPHCFDFQTDPYILILAPTENRVKSATTKIRDQQNMKTASASGCDYFVCVR